MSRRKRKRTSLIHRFVRIDDRPTSLALEPEFWQFLREIAYGRRVTLGRLLSVINQHKGKDIRLASALRIFVAQHYRELAYPCP
jgi:predicted DNA-binding ribbon-helix-helix protein